MASHLGGVGMRVTETPSVDCPVVQVLWSKQIQFYSGQLGFNIRSAYAYCSPSFVATNLARASKAANLMVQMMVRVDAALPRPLHTAKHALSSFAEG